MHGADHAKAEGGSGVVTGFGGSSPLRADWPASAAVLRVEGREVAQYVWRSDLPPSSSPRPYLHPVRTLAGVRVTDAVPDSHPHQLGISIAAPDLDGRNFWGGRTWVAGHGPAWLDNHGTQRHDRWLHQSATDLVHTLRWVDPHDMTLLHERRSITCRSVGASAWSLAIRTELTNATDRPLVFRSPAAQGRAGAGYGGFFWRGPAVAAAVTILSPAGTDVNAVHGATADWLAITGDAGHGTWTMLFVPADDTTAQDPWFLRARDYLGVGSSLTWGLPLVLAPAEVITRHLVTVVLDGAVSLATAAELAADIRPVT
jgi:hypothetical protein